VSMFTSPVAFALATPARSAEAMMSEDLSFKVVRSNGRRQSAYRSRRLSGGRAHVP
jgi:hypothetical protein